MGLYGAVHLLDSRCRARFAAPPLPLILDSDAIGEWRAAAPSDILYTFGGWPGLKIWNSLTFEARRGYHCGTSRGSIERRRVPQVRGGNLGVGVVISSAGVGDAGGSLYTVQEKGSAIHYYLMLPSSCCGVN